MIQSIMQELLQQIDLDYYRSARLLIAHAELDQLRQGRPASVDVRGGDVHALIVDREKSALHQSYTPSAVCWP
jgi:hypothetical protein